MGRYIDAIVADAGIIDTVQAAEKEIYDLKVENLRLRDVIDRAAKAWLTVEGISWHGDVGDAMQAAVNEINRLRSELDHREMWSEDEARARARLHKEIERLRDLLDAKDLLLSEWLGEDKALYNLREEVSRLRKAEEWQRKVADTMLREAERHERENDELHRLLDRFLYGLE